MIIKDLEGKCSLIKDYNVRLALGEIALSLSKLASVVDANDKLLNSLLKSRLPLDSDHIKLKSKLITEVEEDMKDLAMMLWRITQQ
ncbi:hypothetical protein K2X14_11460 [Acetobacter sp. TBRC 12305]|uniref:Uncharacterized protein n=1 Tax=Acetobacter garciniae TaxID=2817435 RepID=A0A939KMI7_9PROT|nr:hypothetical protein [Acetobacter garciniae]MBO1325373.1 hypothetical protein [Acetobacter garciniae]MBX0345455.1 hypothetical protein [Acetobacter garciniae]